MGFMIIAITSVILCFAIALPLARVQNEAVEECFKNKALGEKVESGEQDIKVLSAKELFAIKRPMFTTVGMGGVGPRYQPSFSLFCLVGDELERRRGEFTTTSD